MIRRLSLVLLAALGLVGAVAPGASAATPAPHWSLHLTALPSEFSAADNAECLNTYIESLPGVACDSYQVTAVNTGSAPASGAVTLSDALPSGLTVKRIRLLRLTPYKLEQTELASNCNLVTLRCSLHSTFLPDEGLELVIYVTVEAGATEPLVDRATVEGGKAATVSVETQTPVSDAPPHFGSRLFNDIAGLDGEPEAQAGAHPYQLNVRVDPESSIRVSPTGHLAPNSVEDPRDVVVDLPIGFIGTALATPTCSFGELSANIEGGFGGCPSDTIVGHIRTEPGETNASVSGPIYNMTPEDGVAAEFAYVDILAGTHVLYASVAPGPEGYVLRTTAPELPQVQLTDIVTSFYGNPERRNGGIHEGQPEVPLFTNPAECDGKPLVTSIHMDSWQHPGAWLSDGEPDLSEPNWVTATSESPPVSGCSRLTFEPTITATPSTDRADSPTGLEVAVKVPQTEGTETLATPPLKKAVVTLPEGVSVNPSSANGLGACSLAQIGMSASGQPDAAHPTCPDASKIGTVELETSALPGVLQGQIYVAKQGENPFGSLLAIYIVVNDPKTGVLVKLAGEVNPNPTTGQLQTVVDDSPQFPFSELRTHFFAGARAPLKTSAVCGTYTVTSNLTPWSAPESGPPATPAASFQTSEAAGGGADCPTSPGAEPNHPAFTAGTLSTQAGAYTPFVVRGARADGDQPITQVNLTLPKGLVGKLAGIPYCPEADIALAKSREHQGGGAEEEAHPACPAASEVGVVHVGAGAGPEPYYVTGHAYLTGPYKGGPLGIVIISPAVAGPFDLGDVVVRAALQVDPFTTQISAVSDPIPTILDGIPLDIRSIDLQMSRHEFTLNPTNCERMAITGEAVGQFGSTAALTEPFQVGGCKALAFRPKLRISLKGPTKRAGHPALKAVLTYPKGPGYANIAYAQVGLPGTEFLDQGNLNHVCTQAELKSASCPKSSIYGTAKAWSPLLEAPLEGNVYLGVGFGYKLPALVAELDGQIRVLLAGKVDQDKAKGLRNTYEVVPDAPVSRFVLKMKGGPKYGLLENTAGVCARPQKAAVKFIAQNGIVKDYRQKIENGCAKKGKGKRHKARRRHHHRAKKGKGAGGHGRSSRASSARIGLGDLLGRW